MAKRVSPPLPSLQRALNELGENIQLARLRRRLSATLLAQRAGINRMTLRRVERGDPSVTLGAYANVLHSLGLANDLTLIAHDDVLGRQLQDAEILRPRSRAKKQ